MRPVNQVPAHWSKDFVEHLRTVHRTRVLSERPTDSSNTNIGETK